METDGPFQKMCGGMNTKKLFELQQILIREYFPKLKARKIKIVKTGEYDGKAGAYLEISKSFLEIANKKEIIDLLKHELIHYYLPVGDGHNDSFLRMARKIKCPILDYENSSFIDEMETIGRVEELPNGTLKVYKKSNWDVFKAGPLYNSEHGGSLFRILRKRRRLSRKDVAKWAGISVYMLKKLEERASVFDQFSERYLKKIFYAIRRA